MTIVMGLDQHRAQITSDSVARLLGQGSRDALVCRQIRIVCGDGGAAPYEALAPGRLVKAATTLVRSLTARASATSSGAPVSAS